jgi:hypothetical protein
MLHTCAFCPAQGLGFEPYAFAGVSGRLCACCAKVLRAAVEDFARKRLLELRRVAIKAEAERRKAADASRELVPSGPIVMGRRRTA